MNLSTLNLKIVLGITYLSALLIGLVFLFFIRNPMGLSAVDGNTKIKLIGFISISIWAIVAGSGRWIGFS